MVRGTTPKLTFCLPFNTEVIADLYITFSQGSNVVLEKTDSDCEMNEKEIICHLTQADTLEFNDAVNVQIQLRVKTKDSNAIASNIIVTDVKRILKDGEI